jgi:O-antigen ligase
VNVVYLVLLALTWVGIECFIGGTRLVFSLPAYGVLSLAAILTLGSIWRKRTPPNALCLVSTLILGGWILFRALHSPIEYLALPDFFMMIACLMAYLLTAYYLTGNREHTALIAVLWAIAGLEVWVGIVQFGSDPNFMLFGLLRPVTLRASGMYISANNFAGYLVTVAILSISLGVWSRWRVWAKILAFYIALCCLLGVAISGSRGGYFATIASLIAFGFATVYTIRIVDPRRFLPIALAASGGLAAVIIIAAFLMTHSEMLTHRMKTMVGSDVRIYNWEAAIDHIRVSPWVGTGAGTHLIYGRLFRRPQIQADPVHAHCDYLELLAEYGIVGGICMALFLAAHVRNGLATFSLILRRRLLTSGLPRSNTFAIQLGALCAVAGLAIHSVVDFDMHIPGNALVFAFLFGILANPGIDRPPAFADRITPWAKVLLPALGVLMLWRGTPLFPSEYYSELARRALRLDDFLTTIQYARLAIGTDPGQPDSAAAAPPATARPALIDKMLSATGGNPKNPDPYFYLGEANRVIGLRMPNPYMRRRYYGEAASAFEAGLQVFPQDESMLVRYGQTLDGLHQYKDADAIYQKALSCDPHLDSLYGFYENHLVAEGKKAEADAVAHARAMNQTMPVDTDQKADSRLQ